MTALGIVALGATRPAFAATCTVTTAADYHPVSESPISGSLRACVATANGDSQATDIVFSIPSGGTHTITLKDWLSFEEAGTTVDGFTQSGSAAPTSTTAAVHNIVVDGSLLDGVPVFHSDAGSTILRGLRIVDHTEDDPAHVIMITTASGSAVSGCTLVGNAGGIAILDGASNVTIGGATDGDRNVIEETSAGEASIAILGAGPGIVLRGNTVADAHGSGIQVLDTPEVTIQGNTITGSGAAGIAVILSEDTEPSTITGNTVSGGAAAGIVVFAEAEQSDPSSIVGNTVSTHSDTGIAILGAQAEVTGNLITENDTAGIIYMSMLGDDPSPEAPEDDTVGGGVIGGAGADANELSDNGAGILLFDTTASNASTLEDDNDLDGSNGFAEAMQGWRGIVQVTDGVGEPVEDADVAIFGAGMDPEEDEPLEAGTSDEDGYVGPSEGFDPADADTWFLIPEWAVFEEESELVRWVLAPHLVVTTIDETELVTSYAWDGAKKMLTCVQTGGTCRYQGPDSPVGPVENCRWLRNISDGVNSTRRAKLCVPGDELTDSPLVIGYHGGTLTLILDPTAGPDGLISGGGGRQMIDLGTEYGFITAFPAARIVSGATTNWNDCRVQSSASTANDVLFTQNLVTRILAEVPETIDTDRIYAWGVSNGGVMALALATLFNDYPDNPYDLAAAAAVIANHPDLTDPTSYLDEGCRDEDVPTEPANPPSVLIMDGTEDLYWMPWSGGCNQGNCANGRVSSALDTRDIWIEYLGIDPQGPEPVFDFRDRDETDGPPALDPPTSTVAVTTAGVPAGARVLFYAVEEGGHQVPGTPGNCGEQETCPPCLTDNLGCRNNDISAPLEIWRFFQPVLAHDRFDGNGDLEFPGSPTILSTQSAANLDGVEGGLEVDKPDTSTVTAEYLSLDLGQSYETWRLRFFVDPNGTTFDEPVEILATNSVLLSLGNADAYDPSVPYGLFGTLVGGVPGGCVPGRFGCGAPSWGAVIGELALEDEPHLIEVERVADRVCIRRIDAAHIDFSDGSEACLVLPSWVSPLSGVSFGMWGAGSSDELNFYLDGLEVTNP